MVHASSLKECNCAVAATSAPMLVLSFLFEQKQSRAYKPAVYFSMYANNPNTSFLKWLYNLLNFIVISALTIFRHYVNSFDLMKYQYIVLISTNLLLDTSHYSYHKI